MARRFGGVPVAMLGLVAWSAAAEPGSTVSGAAKGVAESSAIGSSRSAAIRAEGPTDGLLGSIAFAPRSAELSDTGQRSLEEVAEQLTKAPQSPFQIVAHAEEDGPTMDARRISLQRALAVRSFLIRQGVSSRRMIVKALAKQEGAMATTERVDILWPPQ